MTAARRLLGIVTALAVLCCVLACGATAKVREAADRQKRMNDMKQVAIATYNYEAANGTFPPDQQTFIAWAQKSEPQAVAIVQSGKYTFVYAKVRVADVTEGMSNVVMGYDNQPSAAGRVVLMGDGATRMMTEAEFQAAPRLKAKK
jgi:hypothetical protein